MSQFLELLGMVLKVFLTVGRTLKDLINSNNDITRKEEILNDFHIALNSLDYARLVRSIPADWSIRKNDLELKPKIHGANHLYH